MKTSPNPLRLILTVILAALGFVAAVVITVALFLQTSEFVELTSQEFEAVVNGPTVRQSALWRGLYYSGSDKEFHLFYLVRHLHRDTVVRVRREQMTVAHEQSYSRDKSGWVDAFDAIPMSKDADGQMRFGGDEH